MLRTRGDRRHDRRDPGRDERRRHDPEHARVVPVEQALDAHHDPRSGRRRGGSRDAAACGSSRLPARVRSAATRPSPANSSAASKANHIDAARSGGVHSSMRAEPRPGDRAGHVAQESDPERVDERDDGSSESDPEDDPGPGASRDDETQPCRAEDPEPEHERPVGVRPDEEQEDELERQAPVPHEAIAPGVEPPEEQRDGENLDHDGSDRDDRPGVEQGDRRRRRARRRSRTRAAGVAPRPGPSRAPPVRRRGCCSTSVRRCRG